MPKRLIICCDGTWNTAGQRCPTNIPDIHKAIAPHDAHGVEQRAFYHKGVGTSRRDRILGGAFGFGLSGIVRDAYRVLVENYEAGDELFFFGFSRGAFTARSLAGLVRNAGILRLDQAHRIDEAYALYRNADGPDSNEAINFRKSYSVLDHTPIRFIGVFDTVGSLGVPNVGLPGTNFLNRRFAFHDVKLSSTVQSAFQALGIDEARRPFLPAVWEPQAHSVGQELEQVWFAGVHCDVGGGYPDRKLADISLFWMTSRASACGLEFQPPPASFDPSLAMGELHNSRTGLYKWLPPAERELGKTDPDHEYAAATALTREKTSGYAPPQLTRYLAGLHGEMPI